MIEQSLILSFENIRATDLSLVGGKGANLGELTHAGIPIPAGFCLTTRAFQQFVESYSGIDELYALLATVTSDDVERAREVGQQVREALLRVDIPLSIVNAVRDYWRPIGEDQAYAVRSSATAEDLPDASFAGQQDTYLNIIGEVDLLDAIRRCWVSLFTDRAILYRCQNNFSHQAVQLSVVVQQMVLAEKSGILFTADPLTGHRHTIAIDASFGLGEAIVSGLVSPDSYRVNKRNQTIIERQISDKQVAIYPEKDGGIHQEALSDIQRNQAVLSDAEVLKLAELGSRVEAHYGSPQDIEWAILGETIYLLQARPITSLYPIDGLQSPDDSLHIYFSMGHQQNMTNTMSPLGMSTLRCAIPIGRENNTIESNYLRANGGRLFIDLTRPLRHPILKRGLLRGIAQFDALAPETLQVVMQHPEFRGSHGISLSFRIFRGILRTIFRIMAALWWQDLTGTVERVNTIIHQYIDNATTEIDEAEKGEAQIRVILDILPAFFVIVLNWVPQFIAGEVAKRMLTRIGSAWADEVDTEALSLGLSGNAVTEMNLAVGDLAELARQSPQLNRMFGNLGNDGQAWLAQASQIDSSSPFMDAWDSFMAEYGARGPSEIDIMMPRWYEEPLPLLQVLASYLEQEIGRHRVQHQALVDAREAAVEHLQHKSKQGIFGWFRSRLVNRLLHVMNEASVLREHHKFMLVKLLRVMKDVLKNQAKELTADQQLSQPDDIWFLTFPELLALYSGDLADVTELVTRRRTQLEQFQKMSPPMVITSDGETPIVQYQMDDAPLGALIGNPVSPGIVEGVIHIIHDPKTETLKPGEILVAPFTDPGWTPLFINAGGLIMEVGGIMNHGSVVAREYGIPAVVGVRDATTTLQTGQTVRIDGNRGVIEVL